MSAAKRRWLRLGAVVMVLFLAAGIEYDIVHTPPMYLESATVVFSLPKSQDALSAYLGYAPSLITTADAMTQILASPQAQRQIRQQAGGTASVSLALVNLYDEEYPNYGVPLATLTARSLTRQLTARRSSWRSSEFTACSRSVRQALASAHIIVFPLRSSAIPGLLSSRAHRGACLPG